MARRFHKNPRGSELADGLGRIREEFLAELSVLKAKVANAEELERYEKTLKGSPELERLYEYDPRDPSDDPLDFEDYEAVAEASIPADKDGILMALSDVPESSKIWQDISDLFTVGYAKSDTWSNPKRTGIFDQMAMALYQRDFAAAYKLAYNRVRKVFV